MTAQTIAPSVASRVPGRSLVWQVGLQLTSSHESRDTTCSKAANKSVGKEGEGSDGATTRRFATSSILPVFRSNWGLWGWEIPEAFAKHSTKSGTVV